MVTNSKHIFSCLLISIIITYVKNQKSQQELDDDKLNDGFCGYDTPQTKQDCFKLWNNKSDCCAIEWNNRLACLPQSSKSFKGKRGDFTINDMKANIDCIRNMTNVTYSKFFDYDYCGVGNSYASPGVYATKKDDCNPNTVISGSSTCCYLYSAAKMTDNSTKVLKTCIVPKYDVSGQRENFTNTVLAQTLFSGSVTTLQCMTYNSTNKNISSDPVQNITVSFSQLLKLTYLLIIGYFMIIFL